MSKKFWKRSGLLLFSLFEFALVHAQYNITVMLPSGGVYMRSQLWEVTLSNTGTSSPTVVLQMEMTDIQTHQNVLSASTSSFILSPGLKALKTSSIEPIQYSSTNGIADRSSSSLLHAGQYQVCYQLFLEAKGSHVLVADDCDQIEVEPLNPPILTSPENDSVVETNNPQFTWVPPAPAAMFTNLNYNLVISEIYEGQSLNEAIQKNLPLQQAQNLQQPFFSYPLQGPQLENGKRYVWQVIAMDQQRFAARSEIWSFRESVITDSMWAGGTIYLLMDGKNRGLGYSSTDFLHIKYEFNGKTHNVSIVIKDDKGRQLQSNQCLIRQGDNYLNIPLNGRFKSKNNYSVSFIDPGGWEDVLMFMTK
jgi:hypothetical protein